MVKSGLREPNIWHKFGYSWKIPLSMLMAVAIFISDGKFEGFQTFQNTGRGRINPRMPINPWWGLTLYNNNENEKRKKEIRKALLITPDILGWAVRKPSPAVKYCWSENATTNEEAKLMSSFSRNELVIAADMQMEKRKKKSDCNTAADGGGCYCLI